MFIWFLTTNLSEIQKKDSVVYQIEIEGYFHSKELVYTITLRYALQNFF